MFLKSSELNNLKFTLLIIFDEDNSNLQISYQKYGQHSSIMKSSNLILYLLELLWIWHCVVLIVLLTFNCGFLLVKFTCPINCNMSSLGRT